MSFAFFRKYNKILLAVGGSILMIIFLLPQAGSSLMHNAANPVLGTLAGREVRVNDVKTANGEIDVLRRLLSSHYAGLLQMAQQTKDQNQMYMLQRQAQMLNAVMQTLPTGNDMGLTWLLMLQEAQQQGLYASRAESRQVLQGWGVSASEVSGLKRALGVDDPYIYQALGHWQTIMRLRQMVFGQTVVSVPGAGMVSSMRLSEPAVRHFARDLESQVAVDVVPISASTLLKKIPEPTEAEIEDRFKLNADDVPGSGQYGFGYRLPPRVKIEYIAVPLDRARKAVHVDEVEANRYYLEHTDEFLPKPPPEVSDKNKGGADSSAPAPAPAASKTPLPYKDVRDDILKKLTEQKALARQAQAVSAVSAALNAATRAWPIDSQSGYHVIPPSASAIDLFAIAKQVQQDTDVQPNVYHDERDWHPLTELDKLPGLGAAYLPFGSGASTQHVPLPYYLASTHELSPAPSNRLLPLRLQVAMPSQPVIDNDGTIYIFRILDAQTAHAPATLDEEGVRDQVVRDVKLLKAFGELTRQADSYVQQARAEGLAELAKSLGDDVKVENIKPFARRDLNPRVSYSPVVPDIEGIGAEAQFVDGVFKIAEPAEATGKLDAIPADQRIAGIPVDRKLTLYVVQLTEYHPLTEQTYQALRDQIAAIYGESQLRQAMVASGVDPFSFQSLSARVGYSPIESNKDKKQTPE